MMAKASLIRRLEAAEARIVSSERQGLAFMQAVIEVESIGQHQRGDADVVAVDVGAFSLQGRTRVARLAGESIADLEARANPRGCWRAAPVPVWRDGNVDVAGREWSSDVAEVLWIALKARRGGVPW
jgi:hypothetical protein